MSHQGKLATRPFTSMRFYAFLLVGGLLVLGSKYLQKVYAQTVFQQTQYASYQFHTLKNPTGLAFVYDVASGRYPNGVPSAILISDTGNNVIRQFNLPSGTQLLSVAGNGTAGYVNGTPGASEFDQPTGLSVAVHTWVDNNNQYHVYDSVYVNDSANHVRRYFCWGDTGLNTTLTGCPNPLRNVATYAGNHISGYVDGALASAEFTHLAGGGGLAVDIDNHAIRSIGSTVTTFAGTGSPGFVNGYRTSAMFNHPIQIISDGANNNYITDAGNHVIRKIDSSGNVTTFAGSGAIGHQDGGPSVATFVWPASIVLNKADNYFYVTDPVNNEIRRVDQSGNVSTYSGAPTAGLADGTLSQARYSNPTDLIIYNGFMYIADTNNNCVRRINMSTGIVSTYIN